MKYTPSHEWIRVEDGIGVVGITLYAQKELGEVVYIELPAVGTKIKQGDEAVVLESTKAAADIYSPVTGEVVAVNEQLRTSPDLLNQSPEKEGWLFKIKLKDIKELDALLDRKQYENIVKS